MEKENQPTPDSNGTMSAPAVAGEKNEAALAADDCFTQLALVFQRAQTSVAWQKQCVQDVYSMQQTAVAGLQDPVNEFSATEFYKAFTQHIYPLLKISTRSSAIERCIKFVYESVLMWDSKNERVKSSDGEESLPVPYASAFLTTLLGLARSKAPAVRFRVCQLVSCVINGMEEDADIDGVWDPVVETMLNRTKDSNVSCRVFAITSLKRLHDPDDKKDKATVEFKFLMRCDTSERVRMAALNNVGISRVTLNDVLLCLRDKDHKVRVKAFEVINDCIAINNLTLDQRMDVLAAGFEDRNEKVFKACQKLVTKSWYRQRNYNPEKLLQALDIESSERGEKIGEYVVQSLILAAFNGTSGAGRDAEELMDATGKAKTKGYEVYQADLTPESVLFWRGQCEMFQGTAELSKNLNISDDLRETKLESLIGPLVEFCERIEKVWRNSCADQTAIDKDEQEEADVADMLGDLSIDDSSDEEDDSGDRKRRTAGVAGPRHSTLSDRTDKDEQDRADFAIAQEFVCRQLLVCARSFDFADEMGRQRLIDLLSRLLQAVETPMSVIDEATETYIAAHAEGFESTLGIVTIISDITVGIDDDDVMSDEARHEKESQVSMLEQLMEEKRVQKEECKKNDDFVNAQRLKDEIEAAKVEIAKLEVELEKETGEWKWIRALAIARVLLAQVKSTVQQDQYIAPLIRTLIEPAMAQQQLSRHPAIRVGYVKCLASYCLLDPTGEMTKTYLNAILSFAEKDPEVLVRIAAIQGMTDLLLIFKDKFLGQEDVQEGDDLTKETIDKAIRVMLAYASEDTAATVSTDNNESDNPELDEVVDGLRQQRITCVDALTRLTFLRRCSDIKVLKELILLAYRADTESYPEIRQCLVVFLPLFAKSGKINRMMVEQATMEVLEDVMYPADAGKYGKTKPDVVGKFLLFLVGGDTPPQGDISTSIHGRIGIQMMLRVMAEPNVMDSPIISLARAMSKVKLPPTDIVSSFVMRKSVEMLYADANFKCKTTRKMLDSLCGNLEKNVENITNESIQDACDAAWKRFEQSLESERLVCMENYQQRMATKKKTGPRKSSKKSVVKKRPTTIKKKRRLKRGGTMLTNENLNALSNTGDRRISSSRKSWRSSNGSLVSAIQNLDLSLGSITGRPSVVRKAQAMDEIDNLLSSDED